MKKNNKKQIIIVLGMHRSGTSALTGVLTLLGAPMPHTPMVAHEINAKGFYESVAIMDVNNAVLAAGGQRWRDWLPLDLNLPGIKDLASQISAVFDQEFGNANFIAIKDPRMCRLMPAWLPVIRSKEFEPSFVLPFRHPLEVAESLRARYKMPLSDGLLLWLRYILDAEWHTRGLPRIFSEMSELLTDWRACIDRIASETGIRWPVSPVAVATEIDAFLDKDLKHQNVQADLFEKMPILQGWIAIAFAAMTAMSISDSAEWRGRLDRVRESFDDACRVFGPSLKDRDQRLGQVQARLDQQASLALSDDERNAYEVRLSSAHAAFDVERTDLMARTDALESSLAETRANYFELASLRKSIVEAADLAASRLKDELVVKTDEALGAARRLDASKALLEEARRAREELQLERTRLSAEIVRMRTEASSVNGEVDALKAQLAGAVVLTNTLRSELDSAGYKARSLEQDLRTYRNARRFTHIRWALQPARRP